MGEEKVVVGVTADRESLREHKTISLSLRGIKKKYYGGGLIDIKNIDWTV